MLPKRHLGLDVSRPFRSIQVEREVFDETLSIRPSLDDSEMLPTQSLVGSLSLYYTRYK